MSPVPTARLARSPVARGALGAFALLTGAGVVASALALDGLVQPLAVGIAAAVHGMALVALLAVYRRQHAQSESLLAIYRDVVAGTTDGVAIADAASGRLLYVTDAFSALAGRTAGRTSADLFGPDAAAPLAPEALRGLRALVPDSGEVLPVDLSVAAVQFHGAPALALVLRDATDRAAIEHDLRETRDQAIQARALAEEAQQHAEDMLSMKSAFLANMSHELQTPLAEIIGYADMLRDEAPEAYQVPIDAIQTGAERLRQTLSALLELSDLEAGRLPVEHGTVDVSVLAAEVVETHRPQAEAAGLPLLFAAPEPAPALADRALLERALIYLIDNALKFTNEGRVAVVVAASGGEVEVAVRDSGIGMSAAQVGDALAPFKQLSTGDARTHEGSGLGLSLARDLVAEMGGTVTIESEPGEGTLVRVRLPRSPVAETPDLASLVAKPTATRTDRPPVFSPPSGDGAAPDYVIRPLVDVST
ncbi:MAG: HAMP domain-containing sensor histidine kinase [Bacteroidota bacterium]